MAAPSEFRVALVGDSLTVRRPDGYTSPTGPVYVRRGPLGERNPYPERLQRLLLAANRSHWSVGSFGRGGMSVGNLSGTGFEGNDVHAAALRFQPHAVVLMLGTNDANHRNTRRLWDCRNPAAAKKSAESLYFARGLRSLVRTFLALPSRPSVLLALPPPALLFNAWGETHPRNDRGPTRKT